MAHDSVTYIPVYLRFASEEEAAKYLPPATEREPADEPVHEKAARQPARMARAAAVQEWHGERPWAKAIDVVGVIHEPTGKQVKGELGMYAEMAPTEGWHVNLLIPQGALAEELQPFEVRPEHPARRWAGY